MNENQKRIAGLDLLRFFAISYVILLHASEQASGVHPWLNNFFKIGWIGVDLFFVLSGFLIASQVFKSSNSGPWLSLKEFWIKRWWRTVPLYFFALFIYAVVKPLAGFPFKEFNWKFFFFLQNFSRFYDFNQSWSLCIEEHFYIVFPILAFIFTLKKRTPYIWLTFILTSILLRWWFSTNNVIPPTPVGIDFNIRFVTPYHLDSIAMGVFLAGTKKDWIKWPLVIRRMGALIGLILVTYFPMANEYHLPGATVIWMFTILAIGFSLLLIGSIDLKLPKFLNLPIEKIALWSYGIYIWNTLIIRVFHHLELDLNGYLAVALFYLASILSAIPTYYFIEKPFLRIRNKILIRTLKKVSH